MENMIFGCKVNKFYLNKWLSYFRARGFDQENTLLMATCVVTDRAKSKRVKAAKKELIKWKELFLTWCGAFEKGEAMDYEKFWSIYPELVPYKEHITLLGEDPTLQTDLWPIGEYELNQEKTFELKTTVPNDFMKRLHTKKFLVIQSWCDTFCTFCLTIYKRGSQRTRPLEEIIDEINAFVALGGQEIVLTWVNLASRWASNTRKPQENRFSELLEAILERTQISRIRISSLGPEFLDDRFFELMENTRFLPHFHVSIQHFDDTVLKRMNRNYDRAVLDRVLTWLRSLKRPDRELISIGADLIVWFPWESAEQFQTMLDAVKQYDITKMHAFPFSPHQKWETVPAGKLDGQLDMSIKRARMDELLALSEQLRLRFEHRNLGIKRPILLEKKLDSGRQGRTSNYIEVVIPDPEWVLKRGQVVEKIL
jgi:MiaB/RimO family radical SAM methylthiotransferase